MNLEEHTTLGETFIRRGRFLLRITRYGYNAKPAELKDLLTQIGYIKLCLNQTDKVRSFGAKANCLSMAYQYVRKPLTTQEADQLAHACQTAKDYLQLRFISTLPKVM